MSDKFKQLAKESGVSVATVSRVFNKHQYVSEKARRNVIEAARKLNYSPRQNASRDTIGIVIESAKTGISPGFDGSPILNAITGSLMSRDIHFEIIPINKLEETDCFKLKGILLVATNDRSVEAVGRIKDIPVLSVPYLKLKNYIYCDNRESMRIAVEHLAGKGHNKIGFAIWDEKTCFQMRERLEGYKDALIKLDLDTNPQLIQSHKERTFIDAVAYMLKAGATAIIVPAEFYLFPYRHALYVLGKRVPEDISVVSMQMDHVSEFLTPPLDTVSFNKKETAELAVSKLLDLIDGKENNIEIAVTQKLIERESVKDISNYTKHGGEGENPEKQL